MSARYAPVQVDVGMTFIASEERKCLILTGKSYPQMCCFRG